MRGGSKTPAFSAGASAARTAGIMNIAKSAVMSRIRSHSARGSHLRLLPSHFERMSRFDGAGRMVAGDLVTADRVTAEWVTAEWGRPWPRARNVHPRTSRTEWDA